MPGHLWRVAADGVDDLRPVSWLGSVTPSRLTPMRLLPPRAGKRTHPFDISSRKAARPDDPPEGCHTDAGFAAGDRVGCLESEQVDARQGVLIDESPRRGSASGIASAVAAEGR